MPAARSKNTTLSETLKLVRQRRGLSASDVAQRMGMPLRTYHHFEGGYAQLDVERIRRFADATDSDPHAILTAVLLGAPSGPTRVISIAAYQAAFEEYDYSMASAVAMIMGVVQLSIVVVVLAARGLLYRGPAGGGKG